MRRKTSLEIEKILQEQDSKKQYEKLIDYICDYFEHVYSMHEKCDFIGDQCIANRLGLSVHEDHGCCYCKGQLCLYHESHGCSEKSVSCKFFFCEYIEKKYGKIKINKIFPVRKVLNRKQRKILIRSYFTPNDELVEKLLQAKSKLKKNIED